MRLVRNNTFETNSSSTHSIVVVKEWDDKYVNTWGSWGPEYSFGREECRLVDDWDEKLAYIYYLLLRSTGKEKVKFKKRVIKLFNEVNKEKNTFRTPEKVFEDLDSRGADSIDYYIDHSENISSEFEQKILEDDEFLKRFLFSHKSYITIGGDEYRGYNIKTIGFQYDYDDEVWGIDKDGNKAPDNFRNEDGSLNMNYYNEMATTYNHYKGTFWDKLEEYKKDYDVYLKGN